MTALERREPSSPNAAGPLVGIRDEPLSLDEVVAAVSGPTVGAVVTFSGVVRNHDHDRDVDALEYSAHPSATDVLRDLVAEIAARPGVTALAALHRRGRLEVGDLAVVLAVGAAHRGTAFEACRDLIDQLKATVPIWKHQLFTDGDEEWVGTQ